MWYSCSMQYAVLIGCAHVVFLTVIAVLHHVLLHSKEHLTGGGGQACVGAVEGDRPCSALEKAGLTKVIAQVHVCAVFAVPGPLHVLNDTPVVLTGRCHRWPLPLHAAPHVSLATTASVPLPSTLCHPCPSPISFHANNVRSTPLSSPMGNP